MIDNIYYAEAIIFDMDGVVIDSTKEIELFWEDWARRESIPYNRDIITKYIHGRTSEETIELLFANSTPEVKRKIDIASGEFDRTMRPELIKGIHNFLTQLTEEKITVALVTSSPKERVKPLLDHHNVYSYFKEIITGDDIIHGKPDPEPYIKMADKLKIAYKKCLVFEDSDSGIKSALSAEMKVISLNNYNIKDENIIAVIKDFTEINLSGKQADSGLYNILISHSGEPDEFTTVPVGAE